MSVNNVSQSTVQNSTIRGDNKLSVAKDSTQKVNISNLLSDGVDKTGGSSRVSAAPSLPSAAGQKARDALGNAPNATIPSLSLVTPKTVEGAKGFAASVGDFATKTFNGAGTAISKMFDWSKGEAQKFISEAGKAVKNPAQYQKDVIEKLK
jgi:hypothetical protein